MTDLVPLTPEILVPRLGAVLVDNGLISGQDLQATLDHQAELRERGIFAPLGQVMVEMRFIDRPTLDKAVTEQILALRAALQDANYNLERRVEKRTTELQEALTKLSEVSQTKSNFVSNISHELRTPLTHIKGYLDLLVSADLGPVSPEQKRAMGIIQRSTERLERLIEDLILFSTAERGEVTLDPAPFNLGNLCLAVINRAIPRASEKKIDVQLEIGNENTTVDGDEDKIGWILTQLLDNAIKFTPSQKTVGIYLTPEEGFLRITVRDTGIGIPEDRLNEIFEPFHQLDGSSTRRYGGTGLGLALVRRIIEAHGSIIQVFSKVGQGSSFEFLLKRVSGAR